MDRLPKIAEDDEPNDLFETKLRSSILSDNYSRASDTGLTTKTKDRMN